MASGYAGDSVSSHFQFLYHVPFYILGGLDTRWEENPILKGNHHEY